MAVVLRPNWVDSIGPKYQKHKIFYCVITLSDLQLKWFIVALVALKQLKAKIIL